MAVEANGGEPTANELELARLNHGFQIRMALVAILVIASFSLPILACVPVAQALAGKDTTLSITVSFVFTVAITATFGGTSFLLWRKTRTQGTQLQRLRVRITRLEGERDRYRQELEKFKSGGS